jgi:hypothetical protein
MQSIIPLYTCLNRLAQSVICRFPTRKRPTSVTKTYITLSTHYRFKIIQSKHTIAPLSNTMLLAFKNINLGQHLNSTERYPQSTLPVVARPRTILFYLTVIC